MLHEQISGSPDLANPATSLLLVKELLDLPGVQGGAREELVGLYRQHKQAVSDQIDNLISVLDGCDGDTDLELTGDEQDGNLSEDDSMFHGDDGAAGCPISDPGGGNVDDEGEDVNEDGSEWPISRVSPHYDIDQTKGPVNEREAHVQHMRDMGVIK